MNANVESWPVAVHRWYADLEGWAYHARLSEHLPALIDAIDGELKGRAGAAFSKPWPLGWLVGENVADPDCPNPNAVRRDPTIFRVVALGQQPTPAERDRLLLALRRLPLPAARGPRPDLQVQVPSRQPALLHE